MGVKKQILLTLQYLREYPTYFRLAVNYEISQSTAFRVVRKIENILIKSRKFNLPGKKKLLDSSFSKRDVIVDVMECSIERPSHKQKSFYSGKQKEHTLKIQVSTLARNKENNMFRA